MDCFAALAMTGRGLWTIRKKVRITAPALSVPAIPVRLPPEQPTGTMEESRYRWVIVAAGGLLGCVVECGARSRTVAALFGFIYAGTMPLYAVLVRENFPLRMMGTVIGGTAMAGSLGMATGPLAGGLIYDAFASYAWLYVGSWIMGLGAFFIIMLFRPVAAAKMQPAPATAS